MSIRQSKTQLVFLTKCQSRIQSSETTPPEICSPGLALTFEAEIRHPFTSNESRNIQSLVTCKVITSKSHIAELQLDIRVNTITSDNILKETTPFHSPINNLLPLFNERKNHIPLLHPLPPSPLFNLCTFPQTASVLVGTGSEL